MKRLGLGVLFVLLAIGPTWLASLLGTGDNLATYHGAVLIFGGILVYFLRGKSPVSHVLLPVLALLFYGLIEIGLIPLSPRFGSIGMILAILAFLLLERRGQAASKRSSGT